jgi:hypothetical protein
MSAAKLLSMVVAGIAVGLSFYAYAVPAALVAEYKSSASLREIAAGLQVPWLLQSITLPAELPQAKPGNPAVRSGRLLLQILPLPADEDETSSNTDDEDKRLEFVAVLVADKFVSPAYLQIGHGPQKPESGLFTLVVKLDKDRRRRSEAFRLDFGEPINVAWPRGGNMGDGVKRIYSLDRSKLVLTGDLNIWAVRSVASVPFDRIEFEAVPSARQELEQAMEQACRYRTPNICGIVGRLRQASPDPAVRKQSQGFFLRGCLGGEVAGCRGYETNRSLASKPQLVVSDLRLNRNCQVEVVLTNKGPGGFPKYLLARDYRGRLEIIVTAGDQKEHLWIPDWSGISEEKGLFLPEGESSVLPLGSRMDLPNGQAIRLTATLGPVGSAPGKGSSSFSKMVTCGGR